MGAPRVLIYSHEDEPLFELDPKQLYGLTLSESINGEHALSITTSQELEKGQRVFILDEGRWKEFVVAGAEAEHGESLRAFTTYYCPWSLQHDLTVAYIKSRRVGGADDLRGATDAITMVASATDRWGVGTVDSTSVSSGWFYYTSAWDALSRVVSQWQGEVDATITMSDPIGRAIDFYGEQGSGTAKRRFDYGADMVSIKRTVMDDAFVCRIVPRGKGEQVEGDTEAYGRRITIESVNDGRNYIEDVDAVPLVRLPDGHGGYEYPTQIVIYESIETPEELLAAAQRDLEQYTRPKVGYEADVLALSAAGMDAEGVSLGDAVQVVDRTFGEGGLRIEARVVGIERDLLDPSNDSLTIGNFMPSTADAIKQLERGTAAMSESIVDLDGKAGEAMGIAETAQAVANATSQHFWDADDGAHVTEVTKDEWNDAAGPLYQSGANSLWNSLGMLFRKGLTNLLAIVTGDASGVAIYDGRGNASDNIVASFTDSGAIIGRDGESRVQIGSDGTAFFDGAGAPAGSILNGSVVFRERDNLLIDLLNVPKNGSLEAGVRAVSNIISGLPDFPEHPVGFVFRYGGTALAFDAFGSKTATTSDGNELLVEVIDSGDGQHWRFAITPTRSYAVGVLGKMDTIWWSGYVANPSYSFGSGSAEGIYSFSEGDGTTAKGDFSHAQNMGTIALGEAQTVMGTYNVTDTESLLIIGNGKIVGDTPERSNAFTVSKSGYVRTASRIDAGDTITTKGGITASGTITGAGLTSTDEIRRTTDIDPSAAPGANRYRTILRASDAQGSTVSYMQAYQNTANQDGTILNSMRVVGGSTVYNGITLGINADGTRAVSVSDASVWRTALGLGLVTQDLTPSNGTAQVFRMVSRLMAVQLVVTQLQLSAALANNNSIAIGTVPAGYRPANTVWASAMGASSSYNGLHVGVTSSGVVTLYNRSGATLPAASNIYAAPVWVR